MTTAGPILQLDGVDVFYGASQILFGVSFGVERGQSLALLGRNGAGKSTTMKAIIGLAPPRRGRIRLHGGEVQRQAPDRIARAGMGFVPEDRQIFPEHSVQDNLLIGAKPGPGGKVEWTLERIYEVFPILASMRTRMGGRLSGGEQQMLTIARTLMGNPEVLLLDEPSEGLAPIIVEKIGELILRLCGMGITLLIAEQNMHFCLDIASHVAVIDKGHIVYRDTVEGLKANDQIKQRYLAV
jgi:branched-chain amino acid transport system ATP-binding protein